MESSERDGFSTETPDYKCKICGKLFHRTYNLTVHTARHAYGFDCNLCLVPHITADALAQHKRLLHTTGSGVSKTPPASLIDDFIPVWEVTKTSERHSKKFQKGLTSYAVTLKNSESVQPTYENFDKLFDTLIAEVVPQSRPSDYVGLVIESDGLDFPIPLNYVKVSDLNSATIFNVIESRLNSNQNFQLDNKMRIQVDHVQLPVGSGRVDNHRSVGEYATFEAAIKSKKSIIRIRDGDDDDLCFPSAVVMAVERYKAFKSGENNCYNVIREVYKKKVTAPCVQKLKGLATSLLQRAGLTPKPCGIPEIKAIQAVLPEYQITVYTARGERSLVYQGPTADRKIHFIIDEVRQHYHVVTSLTGWFTFPFHCAECDTFYDVKFLHRCSVTCPECRRAHKSAVKNVTKHCQCCDRTFSSDLCYKNHTMLLPGEKSTVCQTIHRCLKCGVVGHKYHHECGAYCSKCGTHYQPDPETPHECYITVKKFKELKNRKFIFFDIESMLVPLESETSNLNSQHVPNLLVAWRVCESCADSGDLDKDAGCTYCGEFVFKGVTCIADFLEFVFNGSNTGATCISHNGQSYDNLFIFRELRKEGKECEFRNRGNKLLEISVKRTDIRFIDSLNFLLTGLAKLPSMFGLKEMKKGFFPHR